MIVKTGRTEASVLLQEECNASQDVIAVRVNRNKINPYYLAVFLNTRFGLSEMNRWLQGQIQPHLSLDDAKRIWVPLIDERDQHMVEKLVIDAADAADQAVASENEAKQLVDLQSSFKIVTLGQIRAVNRRGVQPKYVDGGPYSSSTDSILALHTSTTTA